MNGLRALKVLCFKCNCNSDMRCYDNGKCESYHIIEKDLKVLQILKKKKVNIDLLNQFTVNDIEFIRDRYNEQCFYNLTLEETKLIIEWLKGE